MDKRIKFEFYRDDPNQGVRRVFVPLSLLREKKGWVEIKARRNSYKHFGPYVFRTFRKRLTRDISILAYTTVGMGISLTSMKTTPEYVCYELRCVKSIKNKMLGIYHQHNITIHSGKDEKGHPTYYKEADIQNLIGMLERSAPLKPEEIAKVKKYA